MFLGSVRINKLFERREEPNDNDTNKEEELDSSLWSNFPEDLLHYILARLPLESLARLERVCREWRELWQKRGFLQLRSEVASRNSWFIFQRKRNPSSSAMTVDCYNAHTNTWHELRFDHLPHIQHVGATAGSLLLCVGKICVCRLPPSSTAEAGNGIPPHHVEPPSYKFSDMIVCNPLKPTQWERIPERIGSSVPHVGITVDSHTGNYKVILASLEKTEIYDSHSKTWKLFGSILSPLHEVCSSPVEYKGRLLFLGVGANGHGKVFIYNLDYNKCTSFDNIFSQDPFPRFGYLENCGGRLLMVRVMVSPAELLSSRDLQQRKAVRFERNFQLRLCEYVHSADDFSDGVWRELTSIPMLELESSISLESKEGALFLAGASAAGSSRNDLVCFTMGMKDGKLDCTNCSEGRAVFLYSLSQKLWCFVGERRQWANEGVICTRSLQFQPCLRALPIVH